MPEIRNYTINFGPQHPAVHGVLRKDFPLIGRVEMRYDPDNQRVVYQPVTIEPRILVSRVIREEGYGARDS